MNTSPVRRSGLPARLRSLAPLLLVAVSLVVAACNNGSGGPAY